MSLANVDVVLIDSRWKGIGDRPHRLRPHDEEHGRYQARDDGSDAAKNRTNHACPLTLPTIPTAESLGKLQLRLRRDALNRRRFPAGDDAVFLQALQQLPYTGQKLLFVAGHRYADCNQIGYRATIR